MDPAGFYGAFPNFPPQLIDYVLIELIKALPPCLRPDCYSVDVCYDFLAALPPDMTIGPALGQRIRRFANDRSVKVSMSVAQMVRDVLAQHPQLAFVNADTLTLQIRLDLWQQGQLWMPSYGGAVEELIKGFIRARLGLV